MDAPQRALKVLMLPWLAHGHISPFLELAKKLTKRNILVYLCSTAINLNSPTTTTKLTKPFSESIKLVEIHLPNLPPHHHTTNGLPPHLMTTLKTAFWMAKDTLSDILNEIKPDFFIHDVTMMWAGEVAAVAGIPVIDFVTTGALTTTFLGMMVANRSCDFSFPGIYLHEYEKKKMASNFLDQLSDERIDPVKAVKEFCDLRLIKSCREIEGKYIDCFAKINNKPVIPVGPLIEEPLNDDSHDLIQWLDKKDNNSSIFVSFGSEYFLTYGEIEEIAYGLEISNVNFIWVIRLSKENDEVKVEEVLPKGFLERVGERGKIVKGWAPQGLILRHMSIGGFFSHCGWSSVLESIKCGVPIIAMPMQLDQPINARLVVELGVAVEVEREEKTGMVEREAVAKAIKEVVVEGERGVRRRAKEIVEHLMLKGEEEIDDLVNELMCIYEKRNSM